MRTLSLILVFAIAPCVLFAQMEKPASSEELAAIAERGQALAEYDQAAWHASDAVQELHPPAETGTSYVARKTPAGWVVVWGCFNKDRTEFLVHYEARQGATLSEFTAKKNDPPVPDKDFYFHGALAFELTRKDFLAGEHPNRPYNFSLLPEKTGNWFVYAIPAQEQLSVLPYGGDVRYMVSADGTKIVDRRQMHKIVLEENHDAANTPPSFSFHSHVISNIPEDSDIFYASSRKAVQGEWIATPKFIYEITPKLSFAYLGQTEDLVRLLDKKDCGSIKATLNLCAGDYDSLRASLHSSMQRLIGNIPDRGPLEFLPAISNLRCQNGQIWLNLSTTVRNVGDATLVLNGDVIGKWMQVRFAASRDDLIADKYEKLAFMELKHSDPTSADSYFLLSPGMQFEQKKDLLLNGLNPKNKNAVQILYFTWFSGQDQEIESVRARFAKSGMLYTESVLSEPVAFTLDKKLINSCGKK